MARPRHNSDPVAEEAARQAIVALRLACKISRTAFAQMIGMGAQALMAKETGLLRFKPEEVAKIKEAVGKHLAECFRAVGELVQGQTQP